MHVTTQQNPEPEPAKHNRRSTTQGRRPASTQGGPVHPIPVCQATTDHKHTMDLPCEQGHRSGQHADAFQHGLHQHGDATSASRSQARGERVTIPCIILDDNGHMTHSFQSEEAMAEWIAQEATPAVIHLTARSGWKSEGVEYTMKTFMIEVVA